MLIGLDDTEGFARTNVPQVDEGGVASLGVIRKEGAIDQQGAAIPVAQIRKLLRLKGVEELDIGYSGFGEDGAAT